MNTFWVSYGLGMKPTIYRFVCWEPSTGYYYFEQYKNPSNMISKKELELNTPFFKPFVLQGGKKVAA